LLNISKHNGQTLILFSKFPNAQVCDATGDATNKAAWVIKFFNITKRKSSCESTTALTITNCLLVEKEV